MKDVYAEKSDEYELLAVNITAQDGEQKVRKFIEEKGIDYKVLFAQDDEAGMQFISDYGIRSIPLNVFITKDGEVHSAQLGAVGKDYVIKTIDELTGK